MLERRLTDEDRSLLADYDEKAKQVQQFALACLKGIQPGLLLFGSGGNGKTYSIYTLLKQHNVAEVTPAQVKAVHMALHDSDGEDDDEPVSSEPLPDFGFNSYVVHQGRITPKGLVKEMHAFPRSVHLIEDAETMFDDRNCWGVLRMALYSQDQQRHPKRRITWKVSTKDSYDFEFFGSLIIVGNRILNENLEEVKAVQTRCPCVKFDISNAELISKMKSICEDGFNGITDAPLSKNECYDVLDFILESIESDPSIKYERATQTEKKLNMRLLISGFKWLALSKMEADINWRKMLAAQLAKQVGYSNKRKRADRTHDLSHAAKEIKERADQGEFRKNEKDKILAYCMLVGREAGWHDVLKGRPDDAAALKAFNAAKQNYKNMLNK